MTVEGLVLAKYVANDESVRRAPATEPMATPPTRPMSKTSARYALQRRPKVARTRYRATRKAWIKPPRSPERSCN